MRKNLYLMLLLGAVLGCKDGKSKKNEVTKTKDSTVVEREAHQELYGNWVGEFVVDESTLEEGEELPTTDYSPKINLTIKKITDKGNIFGQNVVKGNLRSFVGKLDENGADIRLLLDEPGDKKSDGRIIIKINFKKSIRLFVSRLIK